MTDIFKDLLFKFHLATKMIHNKQHDSRGMDLQRGQGRLLRSLLREDGISQKELAEKVNINPSSLSELIVKLEEKEHIVRKKDEKDKRIYNIYITDKGRELASFIVKAREDTSREIFQVLNENDQKELLRILDILLEKNDYLEIDKRD